VVNDPDNHRKLMVRAKNNLAATAILANGPVAKTEIEGAAKAEGISERTLYRAKRELKNITAKKDAADGGWTWRLCDEGEIK
jgi:hypothetical protein